MLGNWLEYNINRILTTICAGNVLKLLTLLLDFNSTICLELFKMFNSSIVIKNYLFCDVKCKLLSVIVDRFKGVLLIFGRVLISALKFVWEFKAIFMCTFHVC